jgi:hypothetical protein
MSHHLPDPPVPYVHGMRTDRRALPTQHRRQPLGGTGVAAAEVDQSERLVARARDGVDAGGGQDDADAHEGAPQGLHYFFGRSHGAPTSTVSC